MPADRSTHQSVAGIGLVMLIELDLCSLLLELRPPALGFQNFPLQRSWPRRFSAPLFFALRDFSHTLPLMPVGKCRSVTAVETLLTF